MIEGNPGETLTDAALAWAEEVGIYLTPDASASQDGESPESFRARQAAWKERYDAVEAGTGPKANRTQRRVPSERHGQHLSAQAIEVAQGLYPTPMAADAQRGGDIFPRGNMTLPGVARQMMDGRPLPVATMDEVNGDPPSLPDAKTSPDGERISKPALVLNPRFSEALMGLPRGWLSCERLEMESYHRWWRKHSGHS